MTTVLVLCEESQTITKAFRKRGFEAWSLDIKPCSGGHPEWHIQDDARHILSLGIHPDIIIAHPPCTYLSSAGARWWKGKQKEQEEAIEFFKYITRESLRRSLHVCIENPAGIMSTIFRKPNQYINPFQFGEPYAKRTGLWLYGLPLLKPTNILEKPKEGWKNISYDKTGRNRGFARNFRDPVLRPKTFEGIAEAMADQWGNYVEILKGE